MSMPGAAGNDPQIRRIVIILPIRRTTQGPVRGSDGPFNDESRKGFVTTVERLLSENATASR